jgi:hypothetical protein
MRQRCQLAIEHHPSYRIRWRGSQQDLNLAHRSYGEYCQRFLQSTEAWAWPHEQHYLRLSGTQQDEVQPAPASDRSYAVYYAGFHDGTQAIRRAPITGGLLTFPHVTTEELQAYYRGLNDAVMKE